ncbi:CvfB family protein [Pseudohalioglobus lutimaris]|uniref:GntR family transcriptional regulator n=1 Tax=Pseudohalioglobus lutimaris TaxID=1737061 RepID=A0A2N5X818_9GAMM|nr:S1-like domain-containing RNA-binding protein [Pseudohalioglobus lutimaris]PLW70633.1 GntR family transcriptional regulator [Pseudohalioglobus lutimaris]
MLDIGRFNSLTVLETGTHGAILDGGDAGRLLLSLQQCPRGLAPGDELDVFIFLDAEGDPVPTTRRPAAELGQVAWLEVVNVTDIGAFVDWGVSKDLFIPFAEQQHPLSIGRHTLVKVYRDNQGRLAGSTRIDHWIKDEAVGLKQGEKVSLMIADRTELGFKAIINHEFWGLLYSNELYKRIRKGEQIDGYIARIREDGKVDLTLNQPGFSKDKIGGVSNDILAALEAGGGFLALTDKSPPREIYATFQVSKKVFKQAVGALYKQRRISLESTGIRLVER